MNEPKGRISKTDIDIVAEFSARMETLCAHLGYDHLLAQARTVKRIAVLALYDAKYEARRQRLCESYQEEYPYSIEEDELTARFMRRSADECDSF